MPNSNTDSDYAAIFERVQKILDAHPGHSIHFKRGVSDCWCVEFVDYPAANLPYGYGEACDSNIDVAVTVAIVELVRDCRCPFCRDLDLDM